MFLNHDDVYFRGEFTREPSFIYNILRVIEAPDVMGNDIPLHNIDFEG